MVHVKTFLIICVNYKTQNENLDGSAGKRGLCVVESAAATSDERILSKKSILLGAV